MENEIDKRQFSVVYLFCAFYNEICAVTKAP
jgi:hypothetical protein